MIAIESTTDTEDALPAIATNSGANSTLILSCSSVASGLFVYFSGSFSLFWLNVLAPTEVHVPIRHQMIRRVWIFLQFPVELARPGALAPGIYFLRLTQGATVARARAVVTR